MSRKHQQKTHSVLLMAALLGVLCGQLTAQAVTRFRGENGAGHYLAKTLPSAWSAADIRWNVTLPGKGHSSPVVWGNVAFVTSASEKGNQGWLSAIEVASGTVSWQKNFALEPYAINPNNSYASSTPAVDKERVYVLWFSPKKTHVAAFSHSGKKVWAQDFKGVLTRHGSGTSPIVVDNLLVFAREQEAVRNPHSGSEWLALDCRDGSVRWTVPRNTVKSNSQSTPIVLEQNRQKVLLFTSEAHGFSGIDVASGKVVWEFNPFDARAVSTPQCAAGLIIGTTKKSLYAISVNKGQAELVYQLEHKYSPYVPTPIIVDDLLYNFMDNGNISCHRLKDGQPLWREKPADGFYASPIYSDGKIYGVTRSGKVIVLMPGKQYNLLAINDLGEGTHATPVACDRFLLFRTFSHLMCIGKDD